MTGLLLGLYLAGAGCELVGVWLVVRQVQVARHRWIELSAAAERERSLMQSDLRYRLDHLNLRYGITPSQIHRTSAAVESLVAFQAREQWAAVGLLVAGIVLGAIGNVLSLAV